MSWRWERVEARWLVGVALGSPDELSAARLVVYFGRWKLIVGRRL